MRQADSRQRAWARGAGKLVGLLVTFGAVALLGALLAAAAVPRLSGYQTYIIYGSSMEPTIAVGSLVVGQPVDVEELKVGDIIVFRPPGEANTTITHRVVGIREEAGVRYFRTKGDAVDAADPREVPLQGQVHKFAYELPYLGYFVDFGKSGPGIMLLVLLPAAGLVVSYWAKKAPAAAAGGDRGGGSSA